MIRLSENGFFNISKTLTLIDFDIQCIEAYFTYFILGKNSQITFQVFLFLKKGIFIHFLENYRLFIFN